MAQVSTGKRLARNTAFMYVRMALLMLISLYTSRVVLRELGVEDFGIYNLVGSVVAMFGALRGLFATSIQRFMNYEMGKGNHEKLQLIFNMGTLINIILSIIFVVGVELVGYWFFNYKINIDPTRIIAAKWVFQFSIISAVTSMLTTPYDAVIIANERMDFYAIMAIIEGIFRLIIVFALVYSPFDKLIFYATLQLLVSIIVLIINSAYCKYNFPESHYKRCWDNDLFKEMSTFAGWNFFGNMAFTLTDSCLNMILNIFGGPVVNAARGIAYQIKGATTKLLDAMITVVSPYNTKNYAMGEKNKFFSMLFISSKIYFIVQLCVIIPLTYLTSEILYIWLKQIPEYSVVFVQLVLVHSLIRSIHYPINNLFKSAGNLKKYQITEGIVLSLPLIFSYVLLKAGYQCYYLFIIVILFEIINFIVILFLARDVSGMSLKQYTSNVVFPCLICFIIAFGFYLINEIFIRNLVSTICIVIMIEIVCVLIMFYIGLSQNEQSQILSLIKKNK